MNVLTAEEVVSAAETAGLFAVTGPVAEKLAIYGNLILKWNLRTNLTSITEPAKLLQRHLVESIAAAQALPGDVKSLLDYGSGAGLPGIPIALCRPEIAVTLAESQSKKAAFLQEAVRTLGLATTVFSARVSQMPATQRFDVVTMRAVDKMDVAVEDAVLRVNAAGWLALFMSETQPERLAGAKLQRIKLPTIGHLLLMQAPFVPRGTPASISANTGELG